MFFVATWEITICILFTIYLESVFIILSGVYKPFHHIVPSPILSYSWLICYIYLLWKPYQSNDFCFHLSNHYYIYLDIYHFCCSSLIPDTEFTSHIISFLFDELPVAVLFEQLCWQNFSLVFLHLRMSLFHLHFWRIFLLDIKFLFLILKNGLLPNEPHGF